MPRLIVFRPRPGPFASRLRVVAAVEACASPALGLWVIGPRVFRGFPRVFRGREFSARVPYKASVVVRPNQHRLRRCSAQSSHHCLICSLAQSSHHGSVASGNGEIPGGGLPGVIGGSGAAIGNGN